MSTSSQPTFVPQMLLGGFTTFFDHADGQLQSSINAAEQSSTMVFWNAE
jgi:hypothetical protein